MAGGEGLSQTLAAMMLAGGSPLLSQSAALFCGAVFLVLALCVVLEMLRLAAGARRDRVEAQRCLAAIEDQAIELRALSAAVEQSVARATSAGLDRKTPTSSWRADCPLCAKEQEARRLADTASAVLPSALLRSKTDDQRNRSRA
jgi:hypothetical protein